MAQLVQAEKAFDAGDTTTDELDVFEVTPTTPLRIGTISFDMKKAATGFDAVHSGAVTATFRMYLQIDGTNYRRVGATFVYTESDAENPMLAIAGILVGVTFKVTVQLSADEGAYDLPYVYIREDALSLASIADAVADEATAGHQTAGTVGKAWTDAAEQQQILASFNLDGAGARFEVARTQNGLVRTTAGTASAQLFNQAGALILDILAANFGAVGTRGFWSYDWPTHTLEAGKMYQLAVTIDGVTNTIPLLVTAV
jgi:hypothetical protein